MRRLPTLAAVLAFTACQTQPNQTLIATVPGEPQSVQPQSQLDCREFGGPLTAGGEAGQVSGQACPQPDGSWQIVQNTPGLPPQGYVIPSPAEATAGASTAAQAGAEQSPCNTFMVPVTVGGQQQQATVESCQQPDGSWRITQNTPGLPPQVYIVPPPPAEYAHPYPDYYSYPFSYPYWFASPWFFGLGPTIFVAQRFPHFRHGFGHGFQHGMGRGFRHGIGRGFQHAGGTGGRHR